MKTNNRKSDSDVNYEDDSGELGQGYPKGVDRDISWAIPNFKRDNCANM
jgi:hypothetical protein